MIPGEVLSSIERRNGRTRLDKLKPEMLPHACEACTAKLSPHHGPGEAVVAVQVFLPLPRIIVRLFPASASEPSSERRNSAPDSISARKFYPKSTSTMPAALIQLVSEQTLPNILPALALKPARIVLCHTSRTIPQTQWIRRALELAGLNFNLILKPLGDIPDLHETGAVIRASIQNCRAEGFDTVVNFTGGTKLMGIGAFVAALNEKSASIYTDSENRRFVDGETGMLPLPLADNYGALQRAEQSLTLDVVGAAYGLQRITPGEDPEPYMALALHLLKNPNLEEAVHQAVNGTNPRRPADVLAFLQRRIDGIDPETLRLAGDARILESHGGAWFFVRPPSLAKLEAWSNGERYVTHEWFAALAPLQKALNFLGGGWWELAVFDAARRSGTFRDLRWSANVTTGGQIYEKDILALHGFNLVVISCKRGGADKARLVAAMDELDSHARQIGGSHARRVFCLAQPAALQGRTGQGIRNRAKQTRVTVIGPAATLDPGQFV